MPTLTKHGAQGLDLEEQAELARHMLENGLRDDLRHLVITACNLVDSLIAKGEMVSCKPLVEAMLRYLGRNESANSPRAAWVLRMYETTRRYERATAPKGSDGDPFEIE